AAFRRGGRCANCRGSGAGRDADAVEGVAVSIAGAGARFGGSAGGGGRFVVDTEYVSVTGDAPDEERAIHSFGERRNSAYCASGDEPWESGENHQRSGSLSR